MADVAVEMDQVYKKFRKGQVFDSLRDLVPALSGRLFKRTTLNTGDQREFWALQDVSFNVRRGEAFAIIGANGAGKSTMLKLLSKIMKPTKGRFEVRGRLSALIEVSAAFHADLTGRENIFLNGAFLGMSRRQIATKLDEIIDFSGLESFIDTPVKRYSSGMYARLGFAVAAHVDPEVLIVDEVLSVGDALFQRKCLEQMKKVIRSGATVLFVSHNLKAVAEFCSRTLLLDHGRVITIGPTSEVIGHYMNRMQAGRSVDPSRPIAITAVTVRKRDDECLRFQSGEKATVDIDVTANQACSKIAVGLYVTNEAHEMVFATSTERLGHGSLCLAAGDTVTCRFDLDLNLGSGIFHVAAFLSRYDTQTSYDVWESAATLSVSTQQDITGVVNLFPRVIALDVKSPSSSVAPATTMTVGSGLIERLPQSGAPAIQPRL